VKLGGVRSQGETRESWWWVVSVMVDGDGVDGDSVDGGGGSGGGGGGSDGA